MIDTHKYAHTQNECLQWEWSVDSQVRIAFHIAAIFHHFAWIGLTIKITKTNRHTTNGIAVFPHAYFLTQISLYLCCRWGKLLFPFYAWLSISICENVLWLAQFVLYGNNAFCLVDNFKGSVGIFRQIYFLNPWNHKFFN